MSVTIYGSGQGVVQVVTSSLSTAYTNNTGTYGSTGLSATITPKSSNSKVYIMMGFPFRNGAYDTAYSQFQLTRGGVEIALGNVGVATNIYVVTYQHCFMSYLDSPATTSATTYALNTKCSYNSGEYGDETIAFVAPGSNQMSAYLTLIEISGD